MLNQSPGSATDVERSSSTSRTGTSRTRTLDSGEVILGSPDNDEFVIDFGLEDTYPGFPFLTASAASGCGFCGFLKEELVETLSNEAIAQQENTQEQEFKVQIDQLTYRWDGSQVNAQSPFKMGLVELDVPVIFDAIHHRKPGITIIFNVVTDSGKRTSHSYSLSG